MSFDRSFRAVVSTRAASGRRSALFFIALCCLLATSITARGDESKDQRRERVRRMSATEKEQLRRRYERFDQLDEQEKQRLRELHDQISHHPRSQQLQQTMDRYHQWLKELTPAQRAKLRQLSSQQRIAEIRKVQQEQQQASLHRQGRNLSPHDIKAITKWAGEYAQRQKPHVLQTMSKSEREKMSGRSAEIQKRALFLHVWKGAIMVRPGQLPRPDQAPRLSDADIASLAKALSPQARKLWDQAKSNQQHAQLAIRWVHDAMRARFSSLLRSSFRQVGKQELETFFSHLSSQRREELLSLSPDEMQRALLGMYHRDSRRRSGEHLGPLRFGPGHREHGARDFIRRQRDSREPGHRDTDHP